MVELIFGVGEEDDVLTPGRLADLLGVAERQAKGPASWASIGMRSLTGAFIVFSESLTLEERPELYT